jgi:hypothetical protein
MPVKRPAAEHDATAEFEDSHEVSLVTSFVLPSENCALADSCADVPAPIDCGKPLTARETTTADVAEGAGLAGLAGLWPPQLDATNNATTNLRTPQTTPAEIRRQYFEGGCISARQIRPEIGRGLAQSCARHRNRARWVDMCAGAKSGWIIWGHRRQEVV